MLSLPFRWGIGEFELFAKGCFPSFICSTDECLLCAGPWSQLSLSGQGWRVPVVEELRVCRQRSLIKDSVVVFLEEGGDGGWRTGEKVGISSPFYSDGFSIFIYLFQFLFILKEERE